MAFFILPLLIPAIPLQLAAQEQQSYHRGIDTETFDPLVDNIINKLPPLEVLIDSAIANSPSIKYEDVEIKLWEHKLKEDKRALYDNFGISSSYSYGNLYQFLTSQSSGSSASEFTSDRYETSYSVGVYMKIPIFDLINFKNNIDITKRESEKSILKREQIVLDTKKEIILIYEDLILRQELLKLINEAQVTTKLQVEMAEQEFINGKLSISDLSRLTELHTRNIVDYKKQKSLFYQQYLILEQLVGMKFNLLSEID